ncbi:hypothetical protein DAPPUDRAFT_238055 [Daphnia pulex]|uniref:RING-type E3 ubiquitin transferase n=1 Tax=Daphnia pulex TaxID=6669 RepID=E9G539_DAPPU|nr:hypothetical protein DAPPUDRAFT_238055 [Daphnia pulex]|eukprot:EFX85405.1 hypothetical protein DAPPUDRAFT_238055 [Daphnia pulex]
MSNDQSNSSDESTNENLNPVPNMEENEPAGDVIIDDESAEMANPTSSLSTDDLPDDLPAVNDPTVNDEPAIPSGSSGPQHQPMNYDHGECAICMSPQTDKSRLDCGHVFCFDCLVSWCRVKLQCPTCRQPFSQFVHNITSGSAPQGEVFTPVRPPAPPRRERIVIHNFEMYDGSRWVTLNDGNGGFPLNDEAVQRFMWAMLFPPNPPNDPSDDLD